MRRSVAFSVVAATALAAAGVAAAALIWTIPQDMTVEAQSAAGAPLVYTASVSNPSGKQLTVTCQPASGTVIPFGATTVTCTVPEGDLPGETRTFIATVVDTTGPAVTGLDGRQVEADGPAGSHVGYTVPSATDLVDGPVVVTCSPAPGALFPLGTTTVTCTGVDSRGNAGTASAPVRVVDTTAPTLNVPPAITIQAGVGTDGVPVTDPLLVAFLGAPSARDIVTATPRITNSAPSFFPIGTTVVEFAAVDDAGNRATATSSVTVRQPPAVPAGTPPPATPRNATPVAGSPATVDTTPPGNVQGLVVKPAIRRVDLSWRNPDAADLDHVTITRARADAPGAATVVYEGPATRFSDTKVASGVSYRYLIVAVDRTGNKSAGIAVTAKTLQQKLLAPANGARVTRPPALAWVSLPSTGYYNVQLYRNGQKVLSAWPVRPRLVLRQTWRYNGRAFTLGPGTYVWYVWPGIGARSAAKYGPLLGSSTFTR